MQQRAITWTRLVYGGHSQHVGWNYFTLQNQFKINLSTKRWQRIVFNCFARKPNSNGRKFHVLQVEETKKKKKKGHKWVNHQKSVCSGVLPTVARQHDQTGEYGCKHHAWCNRQVRRQPRSSWSCRVLFTLPAALHLCPLDNGVATTVRTWWLWPFGADTRKINPGPWTDTDADTGSFIVHWTALRLAAGYGEKRRTEEK